MHVDFTISHWIVPILMTIAIWLAAELWPRTRRGNDMFGIGAMIDAYIALTLAGVGTLLTWLGYFAILAWSRG